MTRAAWRTSIADALWPALFAVLANAPARYALALRERQFGRSGMTMFALAMLADIALLGPIFAVALLAASWLSGRRAATGPTPRPALVLGIASVAFVTIFMWAVAVGATEFRIQRGTYPALSETLQGLADPTFLRGSAKIVLFERYSWPTLVALFAFIGCLFGYGKRYFRQGNGSSATEPQALRSVLSSLMTTVLAATSFLIVRAAAPSPGSDAWMPPLVRLAADVGRPSPAGGDAGIRAVLAPLQWDVPTVRSGLHWLGYGETQAECLTASAEAPPCSLHPLARPLPGDDAATTPLPLRSEEPTPLVHALLRLSAALFDSRDAPLTVWHVALESFRADDVHALHSAAPAEIAPFVSGAYEPGTPGGRRTIAFRHAFQSGLRTAQAVSGLWCGLGAFPFQLAVSRDLADLPLRCMPDVLRDAGFDTRLYYGSNASFEHLGEFARERGLGVRDLATLPHDVPRGAFRAATDAALFRIAFEDSTRVGPFAYRFVLTLSGHSPFDLPEDVSPLTRSRAGNAIHEHLCGPIAPEDERRIVTMAYTDDALAAFVHAIEASPQAAQSILLVSADHSTSDSFLWANPKSEATAQVPLFLYLPVGLIASSRDPSRVDEELRSLGEVARTTALSINDVPSMLLALLAHHPTLERLSRERRWHTMGGATSSPHFAARDVTTAQVWGIDAASRVFLVRSDSVDQLRDTGERSIAFSVWDEPLGPVLRDVAGALSVIFRACSGRCAASIDRKTCCVASRQSISD